MISYRSLLYNTTVLYDYLATYINFLSIFISIQNLTESQGQNQSPKMDPQDTV